MKNKKNLPVNSEKKMSIWLRLILISLVIAAFIAFCFLLKYSLEASVS